MLCALMLCCARERKTRAKVLLDDDIALIPTRGASIASGVANLSNTNVGVAVLAMPAAVAKVGLLGGIGMILLAGAVATFSALLLAECVAAVGRPATFAKVTNAAGGGVGRFLTDCAIVVGGAGSSIGYLIVVGDLLPQLWSGVGRTASILAALGVIVPLMYLRRIDSLRYGSYLVLCCAASVLAMVVQQATVPRAPGELPARCLGGDVEWTRPPSWQLLSAFATICFGFAWHPQVVPVLSELERPTRRRALATMLSAWAVVTTIFLTIALGGYLTFGGNVRGDLLVCYPPTRAVGWTRVAFVYIVLFSYPVVSYPVPAALDSLLCALTCSPYVPALKDPATAPTFVSPVAEPRHALLIAAYVAATVAVALTTDDLGLVVSGAGAICATLVVFVIPAAAYGRLVTNAPPCARLVALTLTLVGAALLPMLVWAVVE